ncbi:MAG: hypothetical protein Ct9H300mP28_16450 [Pseudomonadota bacterium]|nr:MAG: hypothetical protein Ct9H300mP28_16450 [Pseudomonadota bacterium]
MARGGFREGAGRKKEYNEPVKKILLGLPESVLQQLDTYASANNLSRPKAVAILVEQAMMGKERQHGNLVNYLFFSLLFYALVKVTACNSLSFRTAS